MRLGVDFGTTNSTVAHFDGETLHSVVVDPANSSPQIMPSMIYFDRTGPITVGSRAVQKYLQHETGREVLWRRREIGEIETTVASWSNDPIEFVQTASVLVDEAARGRLLQSIKTGLFNSRYEGTQVFNRYFRIDEIIALVLRTLRESAEKQLGKPIVEVTLGRPVRFSPNDLADSRAESILLHAAHLAGFKDVFFQLEPVGVAYLVHRESDQRQIALIFDFGGGTLDLTLARIGGGVSPEILATHGVLVGGNDLDRRIMHSLLPHFGGGDGGYLPPDMNDKLLAWQTMPELSQPQYRERLRHLRKTHDPGPIVALETLVNRNLGFALFQAIEQTKQQLSTVNSATLKFHYENIHLEERITRRRFERMIAPEIADVQAGIETILARVGVSPHQVDVVLRTGGSSQVPVFYELLCEFFGEEKQRAIDPLTSVVGGFAVYSQEIARENGAHASPLITSITSRSGRPCELYQAKINAVTYTDRAFEINRLPAVLNRLMGIRVSNLDMTLEDDDALRFVLSRPATVYVAYESTAEQFPKWLNTFSPQSMQVELVDHFALISRNMRIYQRQFPAGEVILGGNQAAGMRGSVVLNYLVFVADHTGAS